MAFSLQHPTSNPSLRSTLQDPQFPKKLHSQNLPFNCLNKSPINYTIGNQADRGKPEGLKVACNGFMSAAGVFGFLEENVSMRASVASSTSVDVGVECAGMLERLMLGKAQKNHLSGTKLYLKISFDTVQQLVRVRGDLLPVIESNQAKIDTTEAYESVLNQRSKEKNQDVIDFILDLREYDVPYHVRFAIDNDLRSGQWYDVSVSSTGVILRRRMDMLQQAEVHICAFDIKTTKLPLKFPDAEIDSVMMMTGILDN